MFSNNLKDAFDLKVSIFVKNRPLQGDPFYL